MNVYYNIYTISALGINSHERKMIEHSWNITLHQIKVIMVGMRKLFTVTKGKQVVNK